MVEKSSKQLHGYKFLENIFKWSNDASTLQLT